MTMEQNTRTTPPWNFGIRRELTAPYTAQQNGPVENALWRAYNAGHAAGLEVSNIYLDNRLEEVKGSKDGGGI